MKRLGVVLSGVVVNIADVPDLWTGVPGEWQPPTGHLVITDPNAAIGDTWTGSVLVKPPPPVPSAGQLAEQARIQTFDTAIAGDAIIQTLKPMSAAQFDTWWDANVTNAAQAIGVLKRLVKLIIRKLL